MDGWERTQTLPRLEQLFEGTEFTTPPEALAYGSVVSGARPSIGARLYPDIERALERGPYVSVYALTEIGRDELAFPVGVGAAFTQQSGPEGERVYRVRRGALSRFLRWECSDDLVPLSVAELVWREVHADGPAAKLEREPEDALLGRVEGGVVLWRRGRVLVVDVGERTQRDATKSACRARWVQCVAL